MVDGCDDKAGVSQRLRSVIMLAEPSAPTVGKNHQRQFRSCDGTICNPRQSNIDGRRNAAERYMLRLSDARIPDSTREARARVEKLDTGSQHGRTQTTQNQSAKMLLEYHAPPPKFTD